MEVYPASVAAIDAACSEHRHRCDPSAPTPPPPRVTEAIIASGALHLANTIRHRSCTARSSCAPWATWDRVGFKCS